jgi:autotransporter-associated beta strand protein
MKIRFPQRPSITVAAMLVLAAPIAGAATYTWTNATGSWSTPANWTQNAAPSGVDATDILIFGEAATPQTVYTSTADGPSPFLLNSLLFAETAQAGSSTTIAGNPLRMGGTSPQILQNGAGTVVLQNALAVAAPLTLGGNGAGVVTFNGPLSGTAEITKTGSSTFRFGSVALPSEQPSLNTWTGKLNVAAGTVRFNNNAATGRTALRGNEVQLSTGATLTVSSELRLGAINGGGGTVSTTTAGVNSSSESIVIHALGDGVFGGTVSISPPTGTGGNGGPLRVRGYGTQTFTGTLSLGFNSGTQTGGEDVIVGNGAIVVLGGTASLAAQTRGSVTLNGGTFRLDNSTTNLSESTSGGRLRLGSPTSTGLETIGGGTFSLIGHESGTIERLSRLQLGSINNAGTQSTARSGALTINLTHRSATGATLLDFQSYSRNSTSGAQYATVNFTANDAAGQTLALGSGGAAPRISFSGTGFTVPTFNGLLNNTGGGTDIGWATVNGTDFATVVNNGIAAVPSAPFPISSSPAANAALTTSGQITSAGDFALNSLKLAPTAAGQTLNIAGAGNLNSRAFVLGGANDFTIQNSGSGTGGITGTGTRYFHVQQAVLTVSVPLAGVNLPIVKAGEGVLALTRNNSAITQPLVINAGAVRSTIANLPGGELQLRGGVVELQGGGTFTRTIGAGGGKLTWSGIDALGTAVDQDRGSGGFAAIGGDVVVDLTPFSGIDFFWEDKGFVNSGFAVVFGSPRADSRVTWVDNLSLSSAPGNTINYNAREIRTVDNPASVTDLAQLSGVISGTIHDDLLKTGTGTLELTGANTYQGATIVHEGTLLVNGSPATSASPRSFLHDVHGAATLGGRGQ